MNHVCESHKIVYLPQLVGGGLQQGWWMHTSNRRHKGKSARNRHCRCVHAMDLTGEHDQASPSVSSSQKHVRVLYLLAVSLLNSHVTDR